jgi:predicted nucleotidyltransferase
MRQENVNRVLEVFYEFSARRFTVRELSKLTKIPRATVHKILVRLKKEEMVDGDNRAVRDGRFLVKKSNYYVEKIVDSGLVDFLVEELTPSAILLFGSIQKGDSVKESDVDIFVESPVEESIRVEMDLDLGKFERKIGHKIQLFVKSDINKLNDHLFNNVNNGIRLFGGVKLK